MIWNRSCSPLFLNHTTNSFLVPYLLRWNELNSQFTIELRNRLLTLFIYDIDKVMSAKGINMHKQNFITVTLIITGLALNPVMGETAERRAGYSKVNHPSVASSIAKVLHNRGLEEDAANAIASELVSEEESSLLEMMICILENHDIVTKEEVLAYLSQAALHKQKLDFKSYDQLLGMVEKIKQKPTDENTRKKLNELAKVSRQLFV